MTSTSLEALDLFFRFGAIGQLVLYGATLILRGRPSRSSALLLALTPCIGAYLLLDVPSAVVPFAGSGAVLALSHAAPFLLWAFAMTVFDPRARMPAIPAAVWVAIAVLAGAHAAYFGYLGGPGIVHGWVHGLALVAVAHVIYIAVRDLSDDLIEPRRAFRLWLVVFVAAQTALILATEMLGVTFGATRVGPTIDSGLFFAVVTATGLALLDLARVDGRPSAARDATVTPHAGLAVEPADRSVHEKLMRFVDAGGYRATNLSIGRLAAMLGVPEHRLRRVINTGLGYRNFSAFLNAFRIAEACERLADAREADTPILELALELGYGSIGPFNRAFRDRTGTTPSAYRKQSIGRARNAID